MASEGSPGPSVGSPSGAVSVLLLGLTITLWASAFPGIRATIETYSPGQLALFRALIASAAFACAAAALRFRFPSARHLPAILLVGLLAVAQQLGLNYGAQTISAGSISFLVGTVPLFTALLAVAFLREKMSWLGSAGLVTSFSGITLISLGEGEGLAFSPGAAFVVAASLAEGVGIVLMKNFLSRYRALEFASYKQWATCLFLLVYAPGLPAQIAAAPAETTAVVVYLGLFPMALAGLIWATALSRIDSSKATSFFYAVPPLTILIAWFWLKELPTVLSLLGGLLALLGVGIVSSTMGGQARAAVAGLPEGSARGVGSVPSPPA